MSQMGKENDDEVGGGIGMGLDGELLEVNDDDATYEVTKQNQRSTVSIDKKKLTKDHTTPVKLVFLSKFVFYQ